MSNLKPEVRVNKLGIPVVKHVRKDDYTKPKGLLARLVPDLNNSYKKALEERKVELCDLLAKRLKYEWEQRDADFEAAIAAETDPKRRRDMITYGRDYIDDLESHQYQVKRTSGFSVSTLEALYEVQNETGDLTKILVAIHREEGELRAVLNFKQFLPGRIFASQTFKDVKSSMGIDDYLHVEPDSEWHDAVSLVLDVASDACFKRNSSDPAMRYPGKYQGNINFEDLWDEEDGRIHMTPELAVVILEHPDRKEDIVKYLGDWCEGEPAKVDIEHLRLYLDNPSPALAEGIL